MWMCVWGMPCPLINLVRSCQLREHVILGCISELSINIKVNQQAVYSYWLKFLCWVPSLICLNGRLIPETVSLKKPFFSRLLLVMVFITAREHILEYNQIRLLVT